MNRKYTLCLCVLAALTGIPASGQNLVADYVFNGNLNSSIAGSPALIAVNPLNQNNFGSATVFGTTHPVYNFIGNASPVNDQAGLSLDTTGLVLNNNYSVQVVVSLENISGWRRLIDVENRSSDNGFYYDPSHHLDIYPVTSSGAVVQANTFEDVVLTVAPNNTVKGYLNNTLEFTTTTTVMNINNPDELMNFFLDNTSGGGQGEYSSGSVAEIKLFSGVLSDLQVENLDAQPLSSVPETGNLSGLFGLLVFGLVGVHWRLSAASPTPKG